MPSLYLESQGHLRCVAQRGLWQVLDGMPASAGITGKTWSEGRPIVVENVATHPDYLEAIPGVVSEICVPIMIDQKPVGALNVGSLSPTPPGMLEVLLGCAELLANRLKNIEDQVQDTTWQRVARASAAISGMRSEMGLSARILNAVADAAGMDSACLTLFGPEGPRVRMAIGPLAADLQGFSESDLVALTSLVGDIRSCYTAGDASGRGFVGTDALRRAGARAVLILPLWARRQRLDSVILAHSRPLRLSGTDVEPLEMLADTVASLLFESSRTSNSSPHRRGIWDPSEAALV